MGTGLERSTAYTYDANGNTLTVTDPLRRTTSTAYDKLDRATTLTDANGGVTAVAYDKAGRRVSLTDPTSNVTQWGYDDAGRTTSETDPLGKVTGYAYDNANRLVTVTDRTGRTRTLGYDAADRLTGDTWKAAGGATLQTNTYTYDANGNQLTAANGNASYAVGYDNLNRAVSVAGPFGVSQAFTYDAADNRLTATDNQGGVTTSTYDNLDRLTGRTLAVGGTNSLKAAWTYTTAGDVDTASRSAWVSGAWSAAGTTAYTTDALGRGTDLVHKNAAGATVGGAAYTFDAGDRITSQTINGATQTFGYDDLDQITSNNGTSISYDKSGNRTVSGYVVGAGNRVTSDGTWTYTHDDTGAVIGKSKSGEVWAYTYDLNGQITSASKSATVGGTVTDAVAYTYDAWGNRVSRVQTGTTSSTERYVVDGWDTAKGGAVGTENFDVTLDLNSSNAVTGRRLFGAGFDAAVARRDAGGAVSWYGADGLGSVRQVFDNSGAVTGNRTFDGFGNVTATSGTGLDRYGYTGTVTDPLTGLVGDNARSYDPTTARWLSEDPKGFGAGDVNLYRYVGNNTTSGRDPSGMDKWYYDPQDPNANSNIRVVPKPAWDPLKDRIAELRAQVVPTPISQMDPKKWLANDLNRYGLRLELQQLEIRLQERDEVAVQKVVDGVVAINIYYRKNQGVPQENDFDFTVNRALGEEYDAQQSCRASSELQARIANYRNAPVPELRRPDGVPEFVWGIANNSFVRNARAFGHYLDHGNGEMAAAHLLLAVGSVVIEGVEWWVGGKIISYGVQGVRYGVQSIRASRAAPGAVYPPGSTSPWNPTTYPAGATSQWRPLGGVRPSHFGIQTIAEDAALARMWTEAAEAAAASKFHNGYHTYLEILQRGGTPSKVELAEAFKTVNSQFTKRARAAGYEIGEVHHWNYEKSLFPEQVLDPRNLVITPSRAVHTKIHQWTTQNPVDIWSGPTAPEHCLPIPPGLPPLVVRPPGMPPPVKR